MGRGRIRHWGIEHAEHDALGKVGEFAHVARPVMRHEMVADGGGHLGDVALEAP
ncbi:hypothetical protein D3C72_2345780 [compost metagenome]